MATLMDQLNRLERAGTAHSRASQKLREAARDVAAHVAQQLDDLARQGAEMERGEAPLPRGYTVASTRRAPILCAPVLDDGSEYGEVINRDAEFSGLPTQRAAAQFAADLASGWLDEAAAAVETLAAAAEAGAAQIAAAMA